MVNFLMVASISNLWGHRDIDDQGGQGVLLFLIWGWRWPIKRLKENEKIRKTMAYAGFVPINPIFWWHCICTAWLKKAHLLFWNLVYFHVIITIILIGLLSEYCLLVKSALIHRFSSRTCFHHISPKLTRNNNVCEGKVCNPEVFCIQVIKVKD